MYVEEQQLGQWMEAAKVGVKVIGGLLKSAAKKKAKKKAKERAKKAAAAAAAQAAAAQAAAVQTAGFGGLPPWALPVGLGLAAVFVLPKLIGGRR